MGFLRLGKASIRLGLTLLSVLASAYPFAASAEEASLCGPQGYGAKFATGSPYGETADGDFSREAEKFENETRASLLQRGRPQHLSANRLPGAPLTKSLEAQDRFVREIFGKKGDTPRTCGMLRLIAKETESLGAAIANAPTAEQCASLRRSGELRAAAIARLEKLVPELQEKFGDPRAAPAGEKRGARFTQLNGFKKINSDEIEANAASLAASALPLRNELNAFWGVNATDERGLISRALRQGARELIKAEALLERLKSEKQSLAESEGRCGSIQDQDLGQSQERSAQPTGASQAPDGAGRLAGALLALAEILILDATAAAFAFRQTLLLTFQALEEGFGFDKLTGSLA
ncbi:MAG: hypothetical protein EOP11_19055 [Proteobacteria bacterium]|nr:MAG: hypothetical protein EOP11_19055 [Pseudomonadota bacterium]